MNENLKKFNQNSVQNSPTNESVNSVKKTKLDAQLSDLKARREKFAKELKVRKKAARRAARA